MQNYPNYNRFYKEPELKRFYSPILNANMVIETAHKLRNANPLSHASAGLIDGNNTTQDINNSIMEMIDLIDKYRATKQL